VDHNLFSGNTGDAPTYLGFFDGTFQNNRMLDNAADAGLIVFCSHNGGQALVANNIIAHNGPDGIHASGAPSDPLSMQAFHNTLVGSGNGAGVLVTWVSATVRLTNTLISGFTTGLTNTFPASATLSANYVLLDSNVGAAGNATL